MDQNYFSPQSHDPFHFPQTICSTAYNIEAIYIEIQKYGSKNNHCAITLNVKYLDGVFCRGM